MKSVTSQKGILKEDGTFIKGHFHEKIIKDIFIFFSINECALFTKVPFFEKGTIIIKGNFHKKGTWRRAVFKKALLLKRTFSGNEAAVIRINRSSVFLKGHFDEKSNSIKRHFKGNCTFIKGHFHEKIILIKGYFHIFP